jgi:hypothetical protein
MSTPPGWYPDPQQPGFLRWWDGGQWTAHAQPGQQSQAGWYGTQPAAWAGQPGGYGAPHQAPATTWVAPSNAGQWGAAPAVYFAPGKKRGKRWWWTFGILASIVVLAGGGFVGLVIVEAINQIQAPQHAADNYLGDLRAGQYASAYARLCAVDTAQVSLTRFSTSKAAQHPVSYHIVSTDVTTANGIRTATVTFDETTSTGQDRPGSTLRLEHSASGWYVCHRGADPSTWAGVPSATETGPTLPAAFGTRNGATGLVLSD